MKLKQFEFIFWLSRKIYNKSLKVSLNVFGFKNLYNRYVQACAESAYGGWLIMMMSYFLLVMVNIISISIFLDIPSKSPLTDHISPFFIFVAPAIPGLLLYISALVSVQYMKYKKEKEQVWNILKH